MTTTAPTPVWRDEARPLPTPVGPISGDLFAALRDIGDVPTSAQLNFAPDVVIDNDLQLALWVCYELHYRGFSDVSGDREWDPQVIALRNDLESVLLAALRTDLDVCSDTRPVAEQLWDLVRNDDGPSVPKFLQHDADLGQAKELMVHKSIYQLKEADPHTWAIPRLAGRAKAALVEIQTDEYGQGVAADMHSELFRETLVGLGLGARYGMYIDCVPGVTLAISNVISMFGLHRDLRGALVGHLAAYEMTSSDPSRAIARGLRRLGANDTTCRFFDEHVTADSLHEQIAAHDMCGGLVEAEPSLIDQVLFGAATSLYIDRRFADHVLARWTAGHSSLRAEAT